MTAKNSILVKDLTAREKTARVPKDERLPQLPLFWLLVAPRNSGKSNLIKNLLQNRFYGKVFDKENTIIFSPTVKIDDMWIDIDIPNKFEPSEFNEIVDQVIFQQEKIKASFGKKECPDILIILDDMINEGNSTSYRGTTERLAYKGRHWCVSVILTSQKYKGISRGIRLNSTQTTYFEPQNMSELDSILDEHADKKNREQFKRMFEYATTPKYTFFTIDYSKPKDDGRYSKNFVEIVKLSDF